MLERNGEWQGEMVERGEGQPARDITKREKERDEAREGERKREREREGKDRQLDIKRERRGVVQEREGEREGKETAGQTYM